MICISICISFYLIPVSSIYYECVYLHNTQMECPFCKEKGIRTKLKKIYLNIDDFIEVCKTEEVIDAMCATSAINDICCIRLMHTTYTYH